jgi:hypothetical protein
MVEFTDISEDPFVAVIRIDDESSRML